MTKDEILNIIESDSLIEKYLYDHHWISGSSTVVYPITVWSGSITIQLATRKNVFSKCIERIVKVSDGLLSDGIFSKGDGSCPATLNFYFNKPNKH